jgi:hypothetical protein
LEAWDLLASLELLVKLVSRAWLAHKDQPVQWVQLELVD